MLLCSVYTAPLIVVQKAARESFPRHYPWSPTVSKQRFSDGCHSSISSKGLKHLLDTVAKLSIFLLK